MFQHRIGIVLAAALALAAWAGTNCTTGSLPSDNFNFNIANVNDNAGNDNGGNDNGGNDNEGDLPDPIENVNDNGGGSSNDNRPAGNDNSGNVNGNGNDNTRPPGNHNDNDADNDNIDGGGSLIGWMGWNTRSIWDGGRAAVEVRELRLANGQLMERQTVRRDGAGRMVRHGLSEVWFANGRLAERSEYLDGVRDGLMQTFYESGGRRMEATWANGRLHGLMRSWDESSRPVLERRYVYGEAQ